MKQAGMSDEAMHSPDRENQRDKRSNKQPSGTGQHNKSNFPQTAGVLLSGTVPGARGGKASVLPAPAAASSSSSSSRCSSSPGARILLTVEEWIRKYSAEYSVKCIWDVLWWTFTLRALAARQREILCCTSEYFELLLTQWERSVLLETTGAVTGRLLNPSRSTYWFPVSSALLTWSPPWTVCTTEEKTHSIHLCKSELRRK